MEISDYSEFVYSVLKDGNTLLKEWDAKKANVIHASLGLSAELIEFSLAVAKKDKENILEELGDILFFASVISSELCKENFVKELPAYLKRTYQTGEGTDNIQSTLLKDGISATEFADCLLDKLKAYTMYAKTDLKDLSAYLCEFYLRCLNAFLCHAPFKDYEVVALIVEVADKNMEKLKKRYPDGYSNKSASERLDKKEE